MVGCRRGVERGERTAEEAEKEKQGEKVDKGTTIFSVRESSPSKLSYHPDQPRKILSQLRIHLINTNVVSVQKVFVSKCGTITVKHTDNLYADENVELEKNNDLTKKGKQEERQNKPKKTTKTNTSTPTAARQPWTPRKQRVHETETTAQTNTPTKRRLNLLTWGCPKYQEQMCVAFTDHV